MFWKLTVVRRHGILITILSENNIQEGGYIEHKGGGFNSIGRIAELDHPQAAERLGVDYSYLFRVLNNEKKGGAKLFAGIYRLCKEENLSFDDYMEFETLEAFNQIKNSTR